jgi:hypothetical protein
MQLRRTLKSISKSWSCQIEQTKKKKLIIVIWNQNGS